MFTTGQWVFGAIFFVAFVIAIYFSYQKDKALHQKFYKGNYVVFIAFFAFILLLVLMKIFLKR